MSSFTKDLFTSREMNTTSGFPGKGTPLTKRTRLHRVVIVVSAVALLFGVFAFYRFFTPGGMTRIDFEVNLLLMLFAGALFATAPLIEALALEKHLGWWIGMVGQFTGGMTAILEAFVTFYALYTGDRTWYDFFNLKGLVIMVGLTTILLATHFCYSPEEPELPTS